MRFLIIILLFASSWSYSNCLSQSDSIRYISRKIVYPQDAKENGYMGKPLVGFWVDTSGSIGDVKILISSEHASLDNEALRVVKTMPKWKSTNKNVYYRVPVTFMLGPLKESEKFAFENKWKIKYLDYYYNEGVRLFKEEKSEDALFHFNEELKIYPKDIDALYNMGTVFYKKNNIDSACYFWYQIKSLGKNDADALINKYCSADIPRIDSNIVFTVVEEMPGYPGGPNEMMRFMQKTMIYPAEAKKKGISGKTYVKFIIEETGEITHTILLRSSGNEELDNEALRVVSSFPPWKPGKQNGKPVRVYFNLPVNFQLR